MDELLGAPFSSKRLDEKIQIKDLIGPTPNLKLRKKAKCGKNRENTRQFNRNIHDHYSCFVVTDKKLLTLLFLHLCTTFVATDLGNMLKCPQQEV